MPDPTKRLWQIPMFLVGAAAFLGAYQGWLPFGNARDSGGNFRHDLASLQTLAAKPNPDTGELRTQLTRVAGSFESYPENGPLAHFVLGTGYMRLAELTADATDAQTSWTLAKQHFEVVRVEQLIDPMDGPRLAYRFAKSRVATAGSTPTGTDFEAVRHVLTRLPPGEPGADGHRLAADMVLRFSPPDLAQAKTSYTSFIAEAGLGTPPAMIARTKLKLSEVHRQLGDADGAKKWLMQIGADAPADVLPTAKAQLARIRMDEGDYKAARQDWELLLAQPTLPAGLKPTATYQLGMCLMNAKTPDYAAAARRFEETAKFEGPEASAAAVRLAEMRLKSDDAERRKDVTSLLAFAVKGIAKPADYPKSPLIPIQDVQAAFEAAIQTLSADGSFEAATATAESYKAVASAGRDREKRAEAYVSWGNSLQKSGGDSARKFTAAADDYAALGQLRTVETDKADLFRKAAGLYKKAGNLPSAISIYEQTVKLPKLTDEVLGPVWLDYFETLLAANKPEEAMKALRETLSYGGPAATTARYTVARKLIDSRVPDKVQLGVAIMDQVAQAETVTPAEQEMHERSLVDVAHAYIQKGDFAEAESRLEKQVNRYPTGVEASLGRLLLGVCLVQRADPRAKPPAANPAKNREEALKLFKQVVSDVDARAKENKPTERDPWLRTQGSLRVLQTYQQMGRPHDVLKDGDLLRREFAGTADELIVLSLMYHAYKQLDKPEGSFTIHGQMKDVFEKIKDKPGVFWAKNGGEYSKEYWEKVWFQPEPPKEPMK
jgi:tetratricopeptide (TPR) repeat protein